MLLLMIRFVNCPFRLGVRHIPIGIRVVRIKISRKNQSCKIPVKFFPGGNGGTLSGICFPVYLVCHDVLLPNVACSIETKHNIYF